MFRAWLTNDLAKQPLPLQQPATQHNRHIRDRHRAYNQDSVFSCAIMTDQCALKKRSSTHDKEVSPPPAKRRQQSTTTSESRGLRLRMAIADTSPRQSCRKLLHANIEERAREDDMANSQRQPSRWTLLCINNCKLGQQDSRAGGSI